MILLACNAGSPPKSARAEASERGCCGLDVDIAANPLNKALELIDGADVFFLLGPRDCVCKVQTLRLQQ